MVCALASALLTACTPPGLSAPVVPEPTTQAAPAGDPPSTLNIGVDGTINGFNPYLVADFSPVARAVAGLVLPSASRIDGAGIPQLDPVLLDSATVTSTIPFTITYQIATKASWSDGTPVTAEDFRYLWQQLRTAPGTVGAAPYGHITAIRSGGGGKSVTVEFDRPIIAWRQLFSPLLPAHILKDAPGGFAAALSGGIPVSAGPYRIDSMDRATAELTLVRNDKYWAQQPRPAKVILRSASPDELIAGLARGDLQAIYARLGVAAAEKVRTGVPAERRRQVPIPATVQLVMNTSTGPLSDVRLRHAIGHAVNLEVLTDLLTGSDFDAMLPVGSFSRLPAAGGRRERPTELAADQAATARNLQLAGYVSGGAYVRSALGPLRLVLGYPAGDQRAPMIARAVQRQLGSAGILLDLVPMTPSDLVTAIASGGISMALLTVPRNPSDAIAVASAYGCPSALSIGANLSRACEPTLNSRLTALLTDAPPDALTSVDELLLEALPVIPIGQPVAQFAVGPGLTAVPATLGEFSWWAGPLAGLATWPIG